MLMQSPCTTFRSKCGPKSARRKLVNFAMLRLPSPARSRHAAHRPGIGRMHRASFGRAIAAAIVAAHIVLMPFGLRAAEHDLRPLPIASPLPSLDEAEPMPPWRDFCDHSPAECAVDLSEPAVLELTAAAWDRIEVVNEGVNSTVKPMTDMEHWGVVDHWDLPDDGDGDCEDYQLLKRKLLAEMGFPRRAMRMTVVLDEAGEGHAVLTIRTDRGDYILDNRRQAVLAWSDTGYEYIKREGSQGPTWVALNGEKRAAAVASR
jgi:predicted transglutaminase-like cysteine proteinase